MPFRPAEPGEVPTLGFQALSWITAHLQVPDGPLAGEQLRPTLEQAQFLLNFYRLDPVTGRRACRRAVLSRSKGWGKSPFLAALGLFEAFGGAVGDGWDADGRPVGRPWTSLGFKAYIRIAAVSEDQTANTWVPLLDMARGSTALAREYRFDANETFIWLPRGRIDFQTSSGTSAEGYRPVFTPMDQTESWVQSNGGKKLAATIRRNLAKTGGSSIESPNSFRPGENSVAEFTHKAWTAQAEGKLRGEDGILWDHREAPAETDMTDRGSLRAGLAYAYGCSSAEPCLLDGHSHPRGWVDLDRMVEEVWDPSTDPADARMYFLNQVTSASDAWLQSFEWAGCMSEDRMLRDRDTVVLGFDGSKGRKRGTSDATALVAVRVSDGHTELLRAWEQPDNVKSWSVSEVEVDAEVRTAHRRFNVVGFYADPAWWESWVASWEAKFGGSYKSKASTQHPIQWWINHGRSIAVVKAVAAAHEAILSKEMSHDGGSVMTRHVLNAFRDPTRSGVWIRKETPDSSRKIDAAWAYVLAWQARLDAVAKGVGQERKSTVVGRIH